MTDDNPNSPEEEEKWADYWEDRRKVVQHDVTRLSPRRDLSHEQGGDY